MRKTTALSILVLLFTACTVVPDPTTSGVSTSNSSSTFAGSWVATSTSATNNGTSVVTSTFSHQLTLSNTPHKFQRWVLDSTPGTPSHPALIENGSWSTFTSNDTTRVVLLPTYRQQVQTVVANFPDTVAWIGSTNTVHWIGPRWNRIAATDTAKEILDWASAN